MMLQALADGILTGSIIALGAIGLTLTMGILRFANFAHAELITWGAYMALGALALTGTFAGPISPFSFGLPLVFATLIAVVLTAALALLIDHLVFRPLRSHTSHMTVVFASFGVSLLVRMVILLIFGGSAAYYSNELQIAIRVMPGLRVMPDHVFTLGLTLAIVVALHLFLQKTRLGLSMRALAENPDLVRINGIDTRVVVRWTWVIGAALAAVSGVLYGLTVQLRPEIGFQLLLPLFAAAILGGVGNVFGAVIGGLIVGLAESLSVLFVPAGYKMAVPFFILLAVLYVRPNGIFGALRGGAK
ncbi:branched-chain amino acid ABC transporter permease [Neorhizobium sp. CSC1952]|uniref:branched-chain amino acid ABC transporter permease n=1 Tax=Neorhizobium sp. CSC1952 TaxID=2978974 RepID=UPI0025A5AF52|nr:branched-chain amino acid ABC transporter permease [Rhizobium sp. CSC1952]WJR69426.1 branched-chain amino acid ABC transporter permease [Rhizobium sp. CSC1952]